MGGFFSPGTPQAAVPQDLQGLRGQNIQLIQQLLGFPTTGAPTGGGAQGTGRTFGNLFGSPALRQLQGTAGAAGTPGTAGPLGGGDPLARLQQFFGALSPFSGTDAQRGSTGVSQYLNQPSPEQRALDVAMPGLQEILSGGGPQFERDLSLANQQGGRFGSANAILRGEATRNLYNQRGQAAQTLGLLAQGAGGGQARLAGFADLENQRRLGILMNLLGVGQQASFNVPTTQSPSPFSQLMGAALPILLTAFGGPAAGAAGAAATGAGGGRTPGPTAPPVNPWDLPMPWRNG